MTTAAASAELRWLDLDRAVRRRVARAVRKGRRVQDPRDAALAVGYAEASLDWLSRRGRLRPFHLLLGLLVVVELIVTWTWPVTSLLYPALGFGFLRLRTPALRRRLTAAREANAELAADWSLTPVRVRLPGHSWFYPGTRRRRVVVVSLAVALGALAGLIATATVASVVHKRRWAAAANTICAREETRLRRLEEQRLDPRESARRRIRIEREALVFLGGLAAEGDRAPLESQLIAWRRYEVELDEWLLAATGDPRVPAERSQRTRARERSQALARRLGAATCARV